ncbi:helix-turn-helix transcriptional regulator [Fusobacterium animalis]|jgi:toxin-antitoxin system, antitoxin component, xre family|uniref:helix-turn-helix domain-containing protein n=1 Tax=Fusobacterium animalis TaxID=76859 RepID=UPI0030D52FBA
MKGDLSKFLAIKRIENNENLFDMARKLDISIAYLSSIENGKREIPRDFFEKIKKNYNLNLSEEEKLKKIISYTKKIVIDMKELSEDRKDISLRYARKIQSLSEEKLRKLREILWEEENDDDFE